MKSRVIILSNLVYDHFYGGVENSIKYLIEEYRLLGYKVIVFAGYKWKSTVPFIRLRTDNNIINLRFRIMPFPIYWLNYFYTPLSLVELLLSAAYLKIKYPSAIVIARNQFMCATLNIFYKSQYLAPGISMYQGSKANIGDRGFIKSIIHKLNCITDIFAIRYCDNLFLFSNSMRNQVDSIFSSTPFSIDEKSIKIVKPGVNKELFSPPKFDEKTTIRKQFNIKASETVILFVGRFVPAKGFDLIFELISEVKRKNLCFLFVGDGPLLPECINKSEKINLDIRFIFVGASNEVHNYYKAADYFFMSSIYEPFGQTILEALACGLPVISFSKKIVNTATDEIIPMNRNFPTIKCLNSYSTAYILNDLPPTNTNSYKIMHKTALDLAKDYSWEALALNLIGK